MEKFDEMKLHSITVSAKSVGKRIKQIRENLRGNNGKPMGKKEFYKLITGVDDKDGCGRWEGEGAKIQMPTIQELARIAYVGNTSIEWLIGQGPTAQIPASYNFYKCDPEPTFRDYCELLFVDICKTFDASTAITPMPNDAGIYRTLPYLTISIPLAACPVWGFYNEYAEEWSYETGDTCPPYDGWKLVGYEVANGYSSKLIECKKAIDAMKNAFPYTLTESTREQIINSMPNDSLMRKNPFFTCDDAGIDKANWDIARGKTF